MQGVLSEKVPCIILSFKPPVFLRFIKSKYNMQKLIANFLMNATTFITGHPADSYLSWRLAIVGIPAFTMLIVPGFVYGKLLGGVGEKIEAAYAIAEGDRGAGGVIHKNCLLLLWRV